MHATFRWYADSGVADRLSAHADEIRSVISGVEGLRGYYLVRTENGTVSVTVADDQAGVDQSTTMAADWIRANLPDLASSPPQVSTGEVVISV